MQVCVYTCRSRRRKVIDNSEHESIISGGILAVFEEIDNDQQVGTSKSFSALMAQAASSHSSHTSISNKCSVQHDDSKLE